VSKKTEKVSKKTQDVSKKMQEVGKHHATFSFFNSSFTSSWAEIR
jgi:hypothetical protein